MQLKKISIYTSIILFVSFISLLLIAIGVKYQESLNNWNDRVIKGEVTQKYANLYLNNYFPKVETWNLSEILDDQILTKNQYGKEVFLGGLITGAAVENNKIFLGFNSGTLIVLSKKGELISKISIRELLKDFALIQSNGGVRSILWIDDGLVFVYYTAKKPDEDTFTIRAALINTQDLKLIDDIELGKFMKNEHFALGGGALYLPQTNSILLAVGAASAPDNLIDNSKSQDDFSLFGKVIKIPLAKDRLSIVKPSIFTKGHRNPQGMNAINNKLFLVEHGPKGGDEINVILENGNYGWNEFSYGTKYGIPDKSYNNYSKQFVEPIFYFTPSIGISDIEKCPNVLNDPGYKDCIILSSMRDGSFYILKPHKTNDSIQSLERVEVGNRIRKVRTSEKSIFLFTDNQSITKISYHKLK